MQTRDVTLNDVLKSKVYVRGNSSVSFHSPERYLSPFLEAVEKVCNGLPQRMTVKVAEPVVNAEESGERNIAYPRVLLEADLGELVPNFNANVGFLYALDLAKPIVKTYSGFNLQSCTNLHIFNADNYHQVELLGNLEGAYQKATKFLQEKEKDVIDFKTNLSKLQNTFLNDERDLNELVGRLLRESPKTRLGTTPVLGGVKLLDDSRSVYYVRPDGKFECNLHKVYNAITQIITDSNDILDKPIKTINLAKLILN